MDVRQYAEQQKDRAHRRGGFSLIEIVIVIAIIGGIMAIVVPRINSYRLKAAIQEAKNMISTLKEGILLFENDMKRFPVNLKELVARPADGEGKWTKGGYFLGKKQLPKDPWGENYQYKVTPEGEKPYDLYSFGPDRRKAPKAEWLRVD
jgi:general secretion pathway protein G